MAYGISSSGFTRPRLADIKTEIEQTLVSTFGSGINLQPGSVFSQLVGVFAEREDLVWQAMEDAYNSQYRDTAFGNSLDNVGALSGIPRKGALPSTVVGQRLFGTAGTPVPAGTTFSVVGAPTSKFTTDADVTLVAGLDAAQRVTFSAVPTAGQWKLTWYGHETALLAYNANAAAVQTAFRALPFASGVVVTGDYTTGFTFAFAGVSGKQLWPAMIVSSNTLTASMVAVVTAVTVLQSGQNQGEVNLTATATGPVLANAGTLTVIVTPVSGLSSTQNVTDASVGRNVETDNEYRARQAETLQVAGAGTADAIRSRLLALTGVTAAIIFENDTDIPDPDGRPPKSFEAVVQGGDDQEIIDLLWSVKPAGIETVGSTSGTALDTMGQSHVVKFSRPTAVPIYVKITITKRPEFPANGVAAATQDVVDAGNALGIGRDVVVNPYLMSSLASIPGIENAEMLVGTAPSPTSSDPIEIAVNEVPTFDSARVDVITV